MAAFNDTSTGYFHENSSMVNGSFTATNSTTVDPADIELQPFFEDPATLMNLFAICLLTFLIAYLFMDSIKCNWNRCINSWVVLFLLMLFFTQIYSCVSYLCYRCRRPIRRPERAASISNDIQLMDPVEVIVTGGTGQRDQENAVGDIAPSSSAIAHQEVHYEKLENVNLNLTGSNGGVLKKFANQDKVQVQNKNEEKKVMNTIEEEDEVIQELMETYEHNVLVESLDKEKVKEFTIEWEMMKILERCAKMENEDEEKIIIEMNLKSENMKLANRDDSMTKEEDLMNAMEEEDKVQQKAGVESNLQKGTLTKLEYLEDVTAKQIGEGEAVPFVGEDVIQKKLEGDDNIACDLQEGPEGLKDQEKIEVKISGEGKIMKTFQNELENQDIEKALTDVESQKNPLTDGAEKMSKESEMFSMILKDCEKAKEKENEETRLGLQRELVSPADWADAKLADDDKIEETVASGETSITESKPGAEHLQVYIGSSLYNGGFYI